LLQLKEAGGKLGPEDIRKLLQLDG